MPDRSPLSPTADADAAEAARIYLTNFSLDRRRPAEMLLTRNLIVLDRASEAVAFRSTMPRLAHVALCDAPAAYLWGFYGLRAMSLASDLMAHYVEARSQRDGWRYLLWEASVWHQLPGLHEARDCRTLAEATACGFLHIGSLDAGGSAMLLHQARRRLHIRAAAGLMPFSRAWTWSNAGIGLQPLLVRCPELVWDLLDELPTLQAIVHEAAIDIDGESHTMRIVTMRSNPSCIVQARVGDHPSCRLYLT